MTFLINNGHGTQSDRNRSSDFIAGSNKMTLFIYGYVQLIQCVS